MTEEEKKEFLRDDWPAPRKISRAKRKKMLKEFSEAGFFEYHDPEEEQVIIIKTCKRI